MAEAVPIRPGLLPPERAAEPNADAVKEIEDLLAAARAGEIIGIAYVASHPADLTSFNWAGRVVRATLGGLVLLQHRMCKADLEDR